MIRIFVIVAAAVALYSGCPLTAAEHKVAFSSYLGGSRDDRATSIAVDRSGNVYVAGTTRSENLPVKNALWPTLSGQGKELCLTSNGRFTEVCSDAFVAKFDPTGALVYLTYLGGSGRDEAVGLGADSTGNVYVTGFTESADFPVVNPIQRFHAVNGCPPGPNACRDVFVAKLNPSGTALLYSTYIGGSSVDQALGLTVDPFGMPW